MPERYTNTSSSGYIVQTGTRTYAKPYVSGHYTNALSPKEKMARQQGKIGNFGGAVGGNTVLSETSSFFSPQLSTDFLELPQSLREKREIYRHFYNTDELVGQAIDLHTELPLSKVRLASPKPRTAPRGFSSPENYGKYILSKFERMCKKIKLLQRLTTIVHHYWLDGTCLPAGTLVTVAGQETPVENVVVGDLVLTHKGHWKPVVATNSYESDGLVSLDIARLPEYLRLTPDHPVEVKRGDEAKFVPAGELEPGDWVRITYPTVIEDLNFVNILENVPTYVESRDSGYSVLRKQVKLRTSDAARARSHILDWLISLDEPTLKSQTDLAEEIGVRPHTIFNVLLSMRKDIYEPFLVRVPGGPKAGPHSLWLPLDGARYNQPTYDILRNWDFKCPTQIPVNDDFLYILGYWLGDGSLSRDFNRDTDWGRGRWNLCFGDPSLEYMDRAEQALVRLLGRDAVTKATDDDRNMHSLSVKGNPAFVEWWSANFGDTSHGPNSKRVPLWVMHLPPEKQLMILAGLIDSDGCVYRTVKGGVQIAVTSLAIASLARDMMLRLGIVPALNKIVAPLEGSSAPNGGWTDNPLPVYCVVVCEEQPAKLLASKSCKAKRYFQGQKFFKNPNTYIQHQNSVYFLLRNIEVVEDETVYSLQVGEDATFRAGYVSTHNCGIFAEDSSVEVPMEVMNNRYVVKKAYLLDDGTPIEQAEEVWAERSDADDKAQEYYQKHYEGWSSLIILPIDSVKITTMSFSDKVQVELIPSEKDRAIVEKAKQGDPQAEIMYEAIPIEVREHLDQGGLIPLSTDPDEGSFAYILSGRKSADSELGSSILDRCLRTLYYREKLRQAQTSIASRAMTPKRIVWAEGLSDVDVDMLREQVDLSLVDPDYSIVANYEIRWEEMGSKDRLLDLSGEYEQTERRLLSGLGVTESLMSGESLYSGDRLKLEVINQRYLHLREILQEYVEENLFKPVAKRMGFVEKDEWGQEVILFPRLSFTRLPLRDSQDTFDAMWNLYQKGSLSIDVILEMLNIDPDDTRMKVERDMLTVNDATFNEVMRSLYSEVGRMLAEKTDVVERIGKYLKLEVNQPDTEQTEDSRF